MNGYHFSVDWFSNNIPVWIQLFDQTHPSKAIEIGSFEGRSTCFLIEQLGMKPNAEIHCFDTWQGGAEHKEGGSFPQDMSEIEQRFHKNVDIALRKVPNDVKLCVHKGFSDIELANLISNGGSNYFDLGYIDGSHHAPDVLTDAVLCFKLIKVGGIMIFDDYLWRENLPGGADLLRCPKIAIDAFTNIFSHKIEIIRAPLNQIYLQKVSD